jgi:anti-sigma B factor antagonist
MSSQLRNGGLEVEHVGRVAVVRFVRRQIVTEEAVEALGEQLLSLGDDAGHSQVVVNFGNVERVSTALLGRLAALQRRLRLMGGGLALCEVRPELQAVLRALQLRRYLHVCRSEENALQPLLQHTWQDDREPPGGVDVPALEASNRLPPRPGG